MKYKGCWNCRCRRKAYDIISPVCAHGDITLFAPLTVCPLWVPDPEASDIEYIKLSRQEFRDKKDFRNGDTVYITDTNDVMRLNGHIDEVMIELVREDVRKTQNRTVKQVKCPSCGGNLAADNVGRNGLCKCEYCNTLTYVW